MISPFGSGVGVRRLAKTEMHSRPLGLIFSIIPFLFLAGDSFGQFSRMPGETAAQFRLYPGLSETSPLYRQNAWVPVSIEVDNPSDREIKGTLLLVPSSDSMGDSEDYRIEIPIQFAPAQRKMIRVLGRFPEWTEDLNLYLGREKVAIAGIREMGEEERVAVFLGEGRREYNELELHTELQDEIRRLITVAHLGQSELLPDRVEGYETATLVAWDGLRMDEPTEHQNSALKQFVELGGTFLIGLGDTGQRVEEYGWTDWLGQIPTESHPLKIVGGVGGVGSGGTQSLLTDSVEWVSGLTVPTISESTEESIFLAASGPIPGDPCLFLDGQPVLYRLKVGAGHVFISRIFWSDWMKLGNPSIEFWQNLIRELPARAPSFSQDWKNLSPINAYLRTSLLGELPGPLFIGGFLGLYTFLLIPVNYFFFRKRKRLELAWLVLPPLALLFSFLAYHIGALQQQGGVIQRQISVAFQSPGSSLARCQAMSALYSPKRRFFSIRPNESRPLPLPTSTDQYQELGNGGLVLRYLPVELEGLYSPELRGVMVNHWSSKEMAFDATVDLEGPLKVLVFETSDQNYRVEIDNRTRFDLENLYLIMETRFHELGAVPKGTSESMDIDSSDRRFWTMPNFEQPAMYGNTAHDFFKMPLDKFLSEQGRSLVATLPIRFDIAGQKALDSYSPRESTRQGVYAMAEIRAPLLPLDVEAELFDQESVSLLLTPVEATSEAKDLRVEPTDWTLRTSSKSEGFEQFVLDPQNQYYWNQSGLPENAVVPPPHELGVYGQFPATATYVCRPNLRGGQYLPIALTGDWTPVQNRFVRRDDIRFEFEWKGLHFQTGEWFELPSEESFYIDLRPGTLTPDGELVLKLEIKTARKENENEAMSFTTGNYEPMGVNLPELTMKLEQKKNGSADAKGHRKWR